ncbi:MAG: hypothetical protein WBP45_07840 [Daejeonella sp.]
MKYIVISALLVTLVSCNNPVERSSKKYIDLKSFFEQEISRLTKSKTIVLKTVSRNEIQQTKKTDNINWKNELNLFIESDINKPSWSASYKITENAKQITYIAIDNNLRTRKINIQKNEDGQIRNLEIQNRTNNSLYQSVENLHYDTKEGYLIDKSQHVLLIGTNQYKITGKFERITEK